MLGIQHAMRMRYVVVCGLFGSTMFSHIKSRTARFSGGRGGGNATEFKMCVLFTLQRLSETFLIIRRIE